MSSVRVLAVRAALLGIVVASGGCFRPKILSGGFACDMTKGAKPCPDDFKCDTVTNLCVTSVDGGTDMAKGGSGGGGGHGGTGGGGGGPVDAQPDLGPCLPAVAVASCTTPSDAGLCDPVCNVGCGDCHDKCSVDNGGTFRCNQLKPASAATSPKGILDNCTQISVGTVDQTDNCAPGTVCLALECPQSRCYQFCRTNTDCVNGATCSRDAGGGNRFCDVPTTDCNPLASASNNSGCPSSLPAVACYLGTNTKDTICDCSYNGGPPQFGGLARNARCDHSRQCGIGYVCFDPTGGGAPVCKPVCALPVDGGANTSCPGGLACSAFGSAASGANTKYGYCNQ